MNLVTVGIPFFNNERTLSYAVKAVLSQTYENIEIFLIDDGSNDKSLEIAKKFEAEDHRCKVISDGKNLGLISRLNQIIDMAQGDFIMRMDADDMLDPDKLYKQISYLLSHPDVDVVTTGMVSLDKKLRPVGKRCCDVTEPHVVNVFKSGEDLLHASMLVRTEWANKNKYLLGFERAEDRELFTRTLGSTKYKIIPEPLYYYVDVQNMTLLKYLKSYESERKAIIANWKNKISFFEMAALVARSLIKSIVIRWYFFLKIEDRLFRGKNSELNSCEIQRISDHIKKFTS
jgi:glycosyltransferase involved in cell wall biosynthesis